MAPSRQARGEGSIARFPYRCAISISRDATPEIADSRHRLTTRIASALVGEPVQHPAIPAATRMLELESHPGTAKVIN
jgi:uncharacterized heparinase superfamily protein